MNEFVYSYPTKVYFGKKTTVDGLAKELAGVGQTVMLAYGGGSVKRNGVYDEVMGILKNASKNVVEFGGILPNPTYAKVQEGARLAKEQGVEFVLALGGGSVVDCCKIICVQALSEEDIWTMEIEQGRFPSQALGLGAVVTASGTGAEMNNGAVITNE